MQTYLIGGNLRYIFSWENSGFRWFLTTPDVVTTLHCNKKHNRLIKVLGIIKTIRRREISTFNFVWGVVVTAISIDSGNEKTGRTRMLDDLGLIFRLLRHVSVNTSQPAPKHFVVGTGSVLLLTDKRCPSDGQIASFSTATSNVRRRLVNTVRTRVILRWGNGWRPVTKRIGSRNSEFISRVGRNGVDKLSFLSGSESIHFFGCDIYGKNTPSLIPVGSAFHHVHSDWITICGAVSPSENGWRWGKF